MLQLAGKVLPTHGSRRTDLFEHGHYFYTANDYFRQIFGEKIIKLSLDGGFTCPNRDGTLSDRGCIFCSAGSGDFAADRHLSIQSQYLSAKQLLSQKWGTDRKYMAYFQAYTNTYAPVERLRKIYTEAISPDDVVALSVATRPDCIDNDVIDLLAELSNDVYVCVELGLQSSNCSTAVLINRCYGNKCYENAVHNLRAAGIDTVTHIILGLPYETENDMRESVDYAVRCGTKGIKLQLLHVLKGTELAQMYYNKLFKTLSKEEYIKLAVDIIEKIPRDIVIHRITGDGARDKLIAPEWSLDKRSVLNGISKEFAKRGTYQGIFNKYGR